MSACPNCGMPDSCSTKLNYMVFYDCGTLVGSGVTCTSPACNEILRLREREAYLEKWQQVVLSKVVARQTENPKMPWLLETWTFIEKLVPREGVHISQLAREAFDDAVREEVKR